jgi:hypothetical protein
MNVFMLKKIAISFKINGNLNSEILTMENRGGHWATLKAWGDVVRCESLAVCHGQSTVIGRMLRVGMKGNSVCFMAYHWQRSLFRVRSAHYTAVKRRLEQELKTIVHCLITDMRHRNTVISDTSALAIYRWTFNVVMSSSLCYPYPNIDFPPNFLKQL